MKDNQNYILFKTISLRYSSFTWNLDDTNKFEKPTCKSFIIKFNDDYDRVSILIHFKNLSIDNLTLFYRKKSARNRKIKKLYPQHKMNLSFENTIELLTYLSSKNYKVDFINIRFKNGWTIQDKFLNSIEFITNNIQERNLLLEKLISISGQGPVDVNSLEINETYSFCTDGEIKLQTLESFE